MLKTILNLFAKKTVTVAPMQTVVVDTRTHALLRALGSLVPFLFSSSYNGDGFYTLNVKDAKEALLYIESLGKKQESNNATPARTWWKVTVTTTRYDSYDRKDVTTVTHEREHHASHYAHIEVAEIQRGTYRNYWFHTQPRYQGDANRWMGTHQDGKVCIEITEIQKSY